MHLPLLYHPFRKAQVKIRKIQNCFTNGRGGETEYFVGAIQESPADASGIGKILRRLKSQTEGPAAKSVILSKRSAKDDKHFSDSPGDACHRWCILRNGRCPFPTLGIPFVGDGALDVPLGRGFRKSEIFGGPSGRPAPTDFIQHRAGSPEDGRCRWCILRNGRCPFPAFYTKESPVSEETGDLFVFFVLKLSDLIRRAETVKSAHCRTTRI